MLKRYLFTPVCLVVLALMLSACDFAVHAKDAHTASSAAKIAAKAATPSPVQSTTAPPASSASPAVQSTAFASTSPVASGSAGAVATNPPPGRDPIIVPVPRSVPASPVLPTFSPDPGTRIIYNGSGVQGGRNESRTFTSSFPATPGFLVHIICRGYGLINVEVSSGIMNELSCPQSDNVNEYYTSASSSRDAIRVTAMGAISWRVVVEAID